MQIDFYADDSAILFADKDLKVISEKLSNVMTSCSNWLVENKLSLHLGKTECIVYCSKRKLRNVNNFKIACNGHIIESTSSVKYLGVCIDDTLSGDSIVNSIVSKVNSRLKFMYRNV